MTVPAPLVPAEVDLRAYDWFPLHHKRLVRSEWWLRASDQAKALNVELWCKAYEEVPAASLPDDDVALSDMLGFGRRDLTQWLAIRDEVLSQWTLCSDGRWYHPVLAAVALVTWAKREKEREKERNKKRKQRSSPGDKAPRKRRAKADNHDVSPGTPPQDPPGETPTRQDRTVDISLPDGRESGAAAPLPVKSGRVWPSDAFEVFWAAYPNKVAKGGPKGAKTLFERLAKKPPCEFHELMDGLERYVLNKPADRAWLHPTTFLNQERWNDQPAAGGQHGQRNGPGAPGFGAPGGRNSSRIGSMLEGALDAANRNRPRREEFDPADRDQPEDQGRAGDHPAVPRGAG